MALELKVQACEGCDEYTFIDRTGTYDATTNPTGYGIANGVSSPSAFTTYTLKMWYPGTSLSSDPDYTLDLKDPLPTPDSDGFYSWTITAAMMGVDVIESGVYTMSAVGVISPLTYIADTQKIFIRDVKKTIDAVMNEVDPTCACKDGCESPYELYAQYVTVACDGICDGAKAQEIISDLYERSTNCC